MDEMNLPRVRRLVEAAICEFDLNLKNINVFTEAASGYYVLTPIIAACSRARNVFGITRDSRYGTVNDIQKRTMEIANYFGVADQLHLIDSCENSFLEDSDIITNLGFVRPIDRSMISRLKKTSVIPLMWETWEYRAADLDLGFAREQGIAVLGTNEHHQKLMTFEYVGHLAMKLLYEIEIEIFKSSVVILGRGEFAEIVAITLQKVGASVSRLRTEKAVTYDEVVRKLSGADVLVVVDHVSAHELIGDESSLIPVPVILSCNPLLSIVHICGGVSKELLDDAGIFSWPKRFAPIGSMSLATDYLGPKPLVDLHVAGLKVGEMLHKERLRGLPPFDAECEVLRKTTLAQGFSGYHPVEVNKFEC